MAANVAEPDLKAVVQRMIDAGESEENIATVIQSAKPKESFAPPLQPDSTALGMAAGAASVPAISRAAVGAATNPNIAKTGAAIGRVIGGIAPTVVEAAQGNGMGALTAAALSGKTAWAGGKAGWFTAKLAQDLGVPIAKVIAAFAPYAQAVSTASGAQGVNDLAQMAEPKRKDIGLFGMTMDGGRTPEERAANPALLNAILEKILEKIKQAAR